MSLQNQQMIESALMDPVKFGQVYSLLSALRDNLPPVQTVDEKYLKEFQDLLEGLELESGLDLKAFHLRFSESQIRRRSGPWTVLRSFDPCERPYLMTRIDAVLKFFSMQSPSEETKSRTIGFNPH